MEGRSFEAVDGRLHFSLVQHNESLMDAGHKLLLEHHRHDLPVVGSKPLEQPVEAMLIR